MKKNRDGNIRFSNMEIRKISQVSHFKEFTKIHSLDLSDNKIKKIEGLENLFQLKELILNFNEITEIKGLESLTELKKLEIYSTNFTNIKGLAFLPQLERLRISGVEKNFPRLSNILKGYEYDYAFRKDGIALIIEYCIDGYGIVPDNPDVWQCLGITYKNMKNFPKAEIYFEKAVETDRDYIPARNELGVFYHYRKNFPEAIRCYKEVLEIDPNNAKAKNRLGNVYRDPNYAKAEKKIEKISKLSNNVIPLEDNISKNRKKVFMEIEIIREYEFIHGQIRFKIGFINNRETVITDLNVIFIIPEALKWISYEPDFIRKGDTIKISKINSGEKKGINLYLEPINCMEGDIRATISYLDAHNKLHTAIMPDKTISITCPIFFTKENANLARVKNLYRNLRNKHQKKILLPSGDLIKIISLIQSEIGSHDIKLVSKEFSQEEKIGALMYYGLTKVKQDYMVIRAILDGNQKVIELEVAGDHEDSITSMLAEITNNIKTSFNENGLEISKVFCPYCLSDIKLEDQIKYEKGEDIFCEWCKSFILNYRN